MENKKTGIIIAIVAVILFVGVAFIFLYEPAKNIFIKPPVIQQQEEITGDLPVLECNYNSDKDAYKDAVAQRDVNLCDCIDESELKKTCKSVAMDISFYDEALTQLDESLCDKIYSEIQKKACHNVVKDSIEQLEESDPEYLARLYAATHNKKAVEELEKITANNQENIDAWITLALTYAEQGLKEQEQGNDQMIYVNKAFDAIEKAKIIDENNSEVYRAEAYVNEIKPDLTQAMSLYDKALSLDSNNTLAHAGMGHVLRMMGILEGAVEEFNKAAELDQENYYVLIYSNLCNLEYSRSNQEVAVKNCKIVTQSNSVEPVFQSEAYQILSMIFMKNQDITQAYNYLLTAKSLTPNDPNLFVHFSNLNFFNQKFTQAEADARKAMELSPTKAASYLALSRALYMQKKFDDAIQVAQKGVTLVNDDVSLLASDKPATERDFNYVIANSYRQLGDEQNQKKYEQKANNISNQNNEPEVIK